MPFPRPNLSTLRAQVAADIAAGLPGVDVLLRFANLRIVGDALAAMVNGLYGYLDWIAKQAVPFTATDEYLEGWSALKGVTRKAAVAASGTVTFNAAGGTLPAGASVSRSDGATFIVAADAAAAGGHVVATLVAALPGAAGNTPVGTTMTIANAIPGISSAGTVTATIAGGADVERDDDLKTRMIAAYSNPGQGGAAADYVTWALSVAGVTRAWARPNLYGAGTVGVMFMMDDAEAAFGGFPQGSNGVAADEVRGIAATGDQLVIANALFDLQPVTSLVYALAPVPNTIAMTIAGLSAASPSTKAIIAAAFASALRASATPGGVTPLSTIEAEIAAVSGASGFVITAMTASAGSVTPGPAGNITSNADALPVPGAIIYT